MRRARAAPGCSLPICHPSVPHSHSCPSLHPPSPSSTQVLGEVGALPDVFTELEINFFLLRRPLGVRTSGDEKQGKVRGRGGG